MSELTFEFTKTTLGNSLNLVVVEPALHKQVKAFCLENKCYPIGVIHAYYDFVKTPSSATTFCQIAILMETGKGPVSVDKWLKMTKIKWSFGTIGRQRIEDKDAREC